MINCRMFLVSSVSRLVRPFRMLSFLLLPFVSVLTAQTVRFIPDSADAQQLWRIGRSTELYIGASFYYMNPEDSIIAWCDTSETDITGELYVMVPGTDSALFLFTNRDRDSLVNISALLGTPIPVRTEIFFMYRFTDTDSLNTFTRYTGQNRVGVDPQDRSSYPPEADFVTREFGLRPGYGHRWAVAGRIRDNSGTPSDTVVFGFEDGNSTLPGATTYDSLIADFDFNDVIFRVTGLHLNVELIPDSLALTISRNPAPAGDTIECTAAVWSDSSGIPLRTPRFDSLIQWRFSGAGSNRDTLIENTGNDSTAFFIGKTSGTTCRIEAWFVSPVSGDTFYVTRPVSVTAGNPAALFIELRSDTASSGFSGNSAVPAGNIQIASNLTSRPVYALWRDRYGNFAGYSRTTSWDTLTDGQAGMTPGIAVTEDGDKSIGEGIIRKTGGSGSLLVTARDTSGGATFTDTITVGILGAQYDSLRLRIRTAAGMTSASSLTLSTDECDTLVAQGRRTDNGSWETIDVQWDFPSPWNSDDASTPQSVVTFCPDDTGRGSLTLIHTAFVQKTIPVTVTPGEPVRLVLYRNDTPLPSDTTANAGRHFNCTVRLFDRQGVWRSEYSLLTSSSPLVWRIIEPTVITDTLDSTGSFVSRLHYETVYLPIKAHRTILLIAEWEGLTDTCQLEIRPGPAYQVVIEPDADWERSPNLPNPVDTAEIPDTRTSIDVYAIIRDSLGNYVDSLRTGNWESIDTIVSVSWSSPACQATVTKNVAFRQGLTRIIVTSADSSFMDSAWVRLLPYHYIRLRITAGNRSIDSLTCTTNDDTTLVAQALRSDTALWREVNVNWDADSSLQLSPVPPRGSSRYTFNPRRTGQGWIAAKLSGDDLVDTVRVTFERGRPLWASLQLLTPEEQRIAGDTMLVVVKIYNRPGLMEGDYCFPTGPSDSVSYLDSIGTGGRSARPVVIVNGKTLRVLTPQNMRGATRQCFHNGVDTIGLVLYYAPVAPDSLHRLRFMAGDLTAATAPFRLLPGPLTSLKIAHPKSSVSPDSLFLQSPDESAILAAIGYDRFGNTRSEVASHWNFTGTLHVPEDTGSYSRIRYTTTTVTEDESGTIRATAVSDSSVSGSLRVTIRGPLATVISATTRDTNGNGLLDRIDIVFSLPVTIRDRTALTESISLEFNGIPLVIDRIIAGPDNTDIRLLLREPSAAEIPQTGWTPLLTLDNQSWVLDGAMDSVAVTCSDGAGPVLWSVTKELVSADNRAQDRVTVVFSEPVYDADGRTLTLQLNPEDLFDVWISDNRRGYLRQALFDGIEGLYAIISPDTLQFAMKNGNDLTTGHFLSIQYDSTAASPSPFSDLPEYNHPPYNNQKVPVNVLGNPTGKLFIGPNPMRSTARRQAPGKFSVSHNSSALDWVHEDGAGSVFQFKIALPDDDDFSVAGKIIIYDFVGNRIAGDPLSYLNPMGPFRKNEGFYMNKAPRADILPASWAHNGSVYDYFIYWNGFTLGGMPAAPGIYRVVVKLVITTSEGKETRIYSNTVGVRHD